MYQVPNSFTFRVQTDEQRNTLNSLANELQTVTGKIFENARDFMFALVDERNQLKSKCIQLEDSLKTSEFNVNTDVNTALVDECNQLKSKCVQLEDELNKYKTEFKAEDVNTVSEFSNEDLNSNANQLKQTLISQLEYESTPTDEQLYSDILEIINGEDEPEEAEDVETEVQYPDMLLKKPTTVREPNENEIFIELSSQQSELIEKICRIRVVKNEDETRMTPAQCIKEMVFNRGTLLNEHGYFKTFIKSSRLK